MRLLFANLTIFLNSSHNAFITNLKVLLVSQLLKLKSILYGAPFTSSLRTHQETLL